MKSLQLHLQIADHYSVMMQARGFLPYFELYDFQRDALAAVRSAVMMRNLVEAVAADYVMPFRIMR